MIRITLDATRAACTNNGLGARSTTIIDRVIPRINIIKGLQSASAQFHFPSQITDNHALRGGFFAPHQADIKLAAFPVCSLIAIAEINIPSTR